MVYYRFSTRSILHCDLFHRWYGMVASLGLVELGAFTKDFSFFVFFPLTTTILYTPPRISYSLSHTVLYIHPALLLPQQP